MPEAQNSILSRLSNKLTLRNILIISVVFIAVIVSLTIVVNKSAAAPSNNSRPKNSMAMRALLASAPSCTDANKAPVKAGPSIAWAKEPLTGETASAEYNIYIAKLSAVGIPVSVIPKAYSTELPSGSPDPVMTRKNACYDQTNNQCVASTHCPGSGVNGIGPDMNSVTITGIPREISYTWATGPWSAGTPLWTPLTAA